MNVLKANKDLLKSLNKEFREAKKADEDYKTEHSKLEVKYANREKLGWCGIEGKLNTINGLLNCKDKFLFFDREGNLRLTKFSRSDFSRCVKFFDGWRMGTIQDIPKGNIICPESWIDQFKISRKKLYVTFTTPDYDYFVINMKDDGEIYIKPYAKNDGVLSK